MTKTTLTQKDDKCLQEKKAVHFLKRGRGGFVKCISIFFFFFVWYLLKGGGTNSSSFLNIGDTFGPQVFLGVVIYILQMIFSLNFWAFLKKKKKLNCVFFMTFQK